MTLKTGRLGWKSVAGLAIAIVIAGQFSGWNFGLQNGWQNMFAATILTALMYVGLVVCVSELASAIPSAAGFGAYSQAAYGPFAGYIVGLAVFIALAIGAGAAANFASAYTESLIGFGGWPAKALLFVIIIGIHLRGVGEVVNLTFAAGALAVVALVVFCVLMATKFDPNNLAPISTEHAFSPRGVFASIPFAVWLFLGVEQAATAAEETSDPGREMPKGLLAGVGTLAITALGVLILAPGGGITVVANAADPLYAAMTSDAAFGKATIFSKIVGVGAVLGLTATFFSLVYSASRQAYGLARDAGMLPFLTKTNKKGAPASALLIVGAIGLITSNIAPDQILIAVVLLLSISYMLTILAFIELRRKRPDLLRPFHAPGGVVTAATSLVLTLGVILACFQLSPPILILLGVTFVVGIAAYRYLGRASESALKT